MSLSLFDSYAFDNVQLLVSVGKKTKLFSLCLFFW